MVTVRLNDGDHEELRRQAGKARLRVPEFIRQRALERRLQSGSPRQLGVAEFRELNRIGVNLNRIARALNQRSDVAASRLDELRRLGGIDRASSGAVRRSDSPASGAVAFLAGRTDFKWKQT